MTDHARDRADRFERLARIEKWRSKFTYSVVAPTTFRGKVAETVNAFRELPQAIGQQLAERIREVVA